MKPEYEVTLYDKAKTGKTKLWKISVTGNVITTTHGFTDGKLTDKPKTIHKGKNIGKKNETTPAQQALKEAKSKVKLQKRKGYVADLNALKKGNVQESYLPMLAKTYKPGKTKIPELAYVQPKFDGIRCIAVKKDYCVTLWSRTGKTFPALWDLARHLNQIMVENTIWDGELYVHGWEFNRISRSVKKESPDSYRVEYHVYDIPLLNSVRGDETRFGVRNVWLTFGEEYLQDDRVKFYPATQLQQDSEIQTWHDAYVQEGYEGLIIRDGNANYLWKHRGAELLKYKEFIDEEFPIIGYRAGTGLDEGTIVFKCHIDGERTKGLAYNANGSGYFDVRPKGTVEDRRAMYDNGWRYVGKMLTVRYQQRSVYDVPVFPVGITVRDYE